MMDSYVRWIYVRWMDTPIYRGYPIYPTFYRLIDGMITCDITRRNVLILNIINIR